MSDYSVTGYEQRNRLQPKAALILDLLRATPGVVTYEAISYLAWSKPPKLRLIAHYVDHIQRQKKLLIRHHKGVGYEFLGKMGIRLPVPKYRPGVRIPPPGYAVCEQRGELTPRAKEVFTMLQSTPGVVTDHAMHHVVWRGIGPIPPYATLRHYMCHIKSVMGVKIRRHGGVGYELLCDSVPLT